MRLTLKETSTLLGKSQHWIYANCYALGLRPAEWLIGAADCAALVRRAFVTESYERYPFDVLASRAWAVEGGRLSGKSLKEAWRRHVTSAEDACELVFSLAAALPGSSVANHAAYVHRISGGKDFDFRSKLKEYAFRKLVGLFLKGKTGLPVLNLSTVAVPVSRSDVAELEEELRKLVA